METETVFEFDENVICTDVEAESAEEALRKVAAALMEAGYVKESYI